MKILVIGGFGFFGGKIAESLKKLPDGDIIIGTRQKRDTPQTLQIDLEDASSLEKLLAFDFVVNTVTLRKEKYEALITYCLINEVRFVETTADFDLTKQLFTIKTSLQGEINRGQIKGSFIFGAGVFPGVSNLLYKQHLKKYPVNNSISLNVRYKVLSGAGKGMCELMVKGVETPCRWFDNFNLQSAKVPFASLQKIPFERSSHFSLQLTMPELLFMNAYSAIPGVKTFISFKPTFISLVSYYFFNLTPYLGFLKRPFLKILYGGFYIMRGILFKNANTDIYISCKSDNQNVSGIWFNNAFLSAGLFLAAIMTLNSGAGHQKGMFAVEDLFDLEPTIEKMEELGQSELKYRYF